MNTEIRTTVLMINYNGLPDLPDLMNSLEAQNTRNFNPVFWDNASTDGSVEYVRENFPWAKICAQSSNLGYAKAANLAARQFDTEFIIFLNTDIRLDPDCINQIISTACTDNRIACAASKMRFFHKPEMLNGVGGCMNYLGYTWDRGMFEIDNAQYDKVEDVLFACGGAALVRREYFLFAGGYDEVFYMYHEDVDICWRFWILGYRVVTAPHSIVYHKFSRSTKDSKGMAWREFIGERNSIRAMIKNYELKNLIPTLWALINLPQHRERKKIQRGNLLWNLRRLPNTLRSRFWIQWKRKVRDKDLQYLINPETKVPIDVSLFSEIQEPNINKDS